MTYGVVIDPARMLLLRRIVEATGAKLVLSTSWRTHWEKNAETGDETGRQINQIFEEYQLEVYDKTPQLGARREEEIRRWLELAAEVENFVVLDDMFLCADFLKNHFVRTSNFRDGLDEEDAQKAIAILNGGGPDG